MTTQQQQKYTLPELNYPLNALEPVISEGIMDLHYNKHHQAYINNLNAALEKAASADLAQSIALQQAIKFNGGGHVNHSIFWTNLAPKGDGGGGAPKGALAEAINRDFGSLDNFIASFNAKTAVIQGSGWGWLGFNKEKGCLEYASCVNQDPLSTKGLVPLLGIDVWEHAYYLDYKNARPKYLEAIWQIVNWSNVEERFAAASK